MKNIFKGQMKEGEMKVFIKRAFVLVLTIALVLTLLPGGFGVDKVEAASAEEKIYDVNNLIKYDLGDISIDDKDTHINTGVILIPEKEGTYPVLFVVHGAGGVYNTFYSDMADILNNAVNKGYIEPMIIVMPTIPAVKDKNNGMGGCRDFRSYTSDGLCSKVVNAIKNETLGNYVDKNDKNKWNSGAAGRIDVKAPMSIMGYSMGGSVALHAGCTLKNADDTFTFINVGACSPSPYFYHRVWNYDIDGYKLDEYYSFVTDPKEMTYSNDSKAHLWLSGGEAEHPSYINSIDDIKYAFNQTETYNKFKYVTFDSAYRGHEKPLFYVELFSFMYYMKNEDKPTASIIDNVCGSYYEDKITNEKGIEGVVNIAGSNKVGETLTASVNGCNASKVSYQWRRGKDDISGATSESYKLTSADAGKKISCKVTDKSGSLTGFVSGYVYCEKSGTTPQQEFTVKKKTVDPLTVSYKDQFTLEVTATGQNLSYEWQYRPMGDLQHGWKTSDDPSKNSPVFTNTCAIRDVEYQCVVKSGNETKYSGIFKVYVKPIVSAIKTNLTDNKVEEGKDFSVTVSVEGTELKYQWMTSKDKTNWIAINGATGATLKTVGGTGGTTGYYMCKVTSCSQTVDSGIVSVSFLAKPTAAPTAKPTDKPTAKPTAAPTAKPTAAPTAKPTAAPTAAPTAKPTAAPTAKPTAAPTAKPTAAPTAKPTAAPTAKPTAVPTAKPTAAPTAKPTAAPTAKPTAAPINNPTDNPTEAPTEAPSEVPTEQPADTPIELPTVEPISQPELTPTNQPEVIPTEQPTANPTEESNQEETTTVKEGALLSFEKTGNEYKITKVITKDGKLIGGNVTYMRCTNKNVKKVTIPAYIKINGVRFNVTKINKKAFKGCSKLKKITIKTKKLTKIGSKAFTGIHKKANIIVPKSKYKKYKKMIKKAKTPKKVKITK